MKKEYSDRGGGQIRYALSKMNNSIIRFGGNDPSEGNHVLRNKYAVEGQSSAVWMENNFMEIGRSVIQNPTNAMHENNEVGVYIKHNTWDDSYLLIAGSALNPPAHVIVNENQFNDTYVRASDLPHSSTEYTVVHSNIFDVSSNYPGSTYLLELTNFEFGQIGNNTFNNNGTVTLTAIQVKDCRDMVLSENEITEFDRGITFVDNNIRAQFSCNVFDGCMTGVYFHNALMSDQGDGSQGPENVWRNDFFGSFRMNGNTIFSPAIDYHERNPSLFPNNSPFQGNGIPLGFSASISSQSSTGSGCYVLSASQKRESIASIKVFPNPFNQNLTIEVGEKFHYHIIDLTGKTILSGTSSGAFEEIEISLPQGIYTLLIMDLQHRQEVFKLIRK
jgi:hypothetical protein